ncbi:MAG: N-acetyltransferase [Nocardioidaceae bacterium]|nr:N-acetyltransferase [Nocardioidaceae bacterium]NUS49760.1 N-acetyltransferase [Nocardioidaceae bacterium]
MPDTDLVVVDNPDLHRYEARAPDGTVLGFSAYRLAGDTVVFTHTEVDPATEGQGVGSRLVRGALDDVRRRGVLMVPRCPFVKAYVERHPEYTDLVDTDD